MGLLRSILELPFYLLQKGWEIIRYFIIFLFYLIKGIFWLFTPIIGEINCHWSLPNWLAKIKTSYDSIGMALNKRKLLIGSTIIVTAIAIISINYLYHWNLNRPKPVEAATNVKNTYSVRIDPPTFKDYRLKVNFLGSSHSPAPLELINKEITQGISISPKIEGTWVWANDNTIIFEPLTKSWPLGETYQVNLDDKKLLADNNFLKKNSVYHTFISPEFDYKLNPTGKLFYDPTQDYALKVINSITFNYPVDKQTLEKNIKLSLYEIIDDKDKDDKFLENIDFTLAYNEDNTVAYITSSALPILKNSGYLKIEIDKGVTSSLGGTPVFTTVASTINLPGKYNLEIIDSELDIVSGTNNDLKQVLNISLSQVVNDEELAKMIRVWQLPEDNNKNNNDEEKKYDDDDDDDDDDDYNYSFERYFEQSSIYVDEKLLAQAKPVELKLRKGEDNDNKVVSFDLQADQKSKLYIVIDRNLVAQNGYILGEEYKKVLTVPKYSKFASFTSSGSLLSLSGEKKILLVSRNIKHLKLQIDRVIPSQLHHLPSFNRGYSLEDMDFGRNSNDHFVDRFVFTKEITGPAQSVQETAFDLTSYLTKNTNDVKNRGVFILSVYGNDGLNDDGKHQKPNKIKYNFMQSRLIVVTDLGIIAKKSLDNSYDLFIQSINTGEPVSNAKVTVMGINGVTITSQVTDESGHVKFLPLSEYDQGVKPVVFIVEKDQDLSFLPIDKSSTNLEFSRFGTYGEEETVDGGQLRSHIFTDRGIYRPGDTLHVGTIVKAQKWAKSLAGITLEAEIHDAKSNIALKKPIVLDNSGFNEISYKTSYSSPTGEWFIYLYLKNDNEKQRILLGIESFIVREFEPDKTQVSLKLLPEIKAGWRKPETLKAQITAKNLIGTDAANRRVTNTLILQPFSTQFTKYEDYYFYSSSLVNDQSFKVELDEQNTDENGIVNVDIYKNLNSFKGNYILKMLTEVFEPDSGRSVAATATTLVSPNDYLVGVKKDNYDWNFFKDSKNYLEFIAINPLLEKIDLNDLKLSVFEEKKVSVLVKQPSNNYQYESRSKVSLISQKPFAISKDKTIYQFDTQNPGNFIIEIRDKNDNLLHKIQYEVKGDSNYERSFYRNSGLDLKIDKTNYNPGDEIEIAIKTPYVGSGIITIERDKVYAWKWFHTDTTSSIQKITIPQDIVGNAYINIQFIRDPNSEEIFLSPLSYGVVPFRISTTQFDDKLTLQVPEKIKSGNKLPITLHSNSPQKAIIFAVDEGILQITKYRLVNPLNSFFAKKQLSVKTLQIMNMILPEFRHLIYSSAPGGDNGNNMEFAGHLNPFKRKGDEPIVYWSGIIDVNGDKTVEYQVPNYFNGELRIMAVSVGENTMGRTQTSTTVHNDIVLQPNAPYFATPNDEFEVSLNLTNLIENMGDKTIPISVNVTTTPHLSIIGENEKTIELATGKNGVLNFNFKVNSQLGNADLHFTAVAGDIKVTRDISLSVRPSSEYRLTTMMGRIDGHKQEFTGFRDMYSEFSKRQASASYSPFVLSKGLGTYLQNYPHNCSEQIISRAIPALVAKKYADFDLISQEENISLSDVFQILQSRQNSSGVIGLWYPTNEEDPFVTLYAVHFMLDAKDMGQAIPQKMLDNANHYLEYLVNRVAFDLNQVRSRAYAIYLLTRQNKIMTNYLASLLTDLNRKYDASEWETDIMAMYIASSYKMLKMDKQAEELLKPVWKKMEKAYDNAWWTNNYYDPLVVDASKIYLINKHFSEKAQDIPAQAFENMVLMLNKQKYTTLSAAMTIMALSNYSSNIVNAQLTNDSLQISTASRGSDKQKLIANLQGILAKAKFAAEDNTLYVNNVTDLPAWYMISQQGYDKNISSEPIKSGLEIYREFTDKNGKPVEQVELGETINVTIKVQALSQEGATNIAVVDLLPAGFEVVQQAMNSEQSDNEDDNGDEQNGWQSPIAIKPHGYTWYPDYTDVREDRVIIYGSTDQGAVKEFSYQIKATNVGTYTIPPSFAEAMYNRDIQAISKAGNKIKVVSPPQQ